MESDLRSKKASKTDFVL
jgi:hypothetical protein